MIFRDMLAMLALAAVWGGSFLFLHVAAPLVGPVGLAAFRVGSASLVLLPIEKLRALWTWLLDRSSSDREAAHDGVDNDNDEAASPDSLFDSGDVEAL